MESLPSSLAKFVLPRQCLPWDYRHGDGPRNEHDYPSTDPLDGTLIGLSNHTSSPSPRCLHKNISSVCVNAVDDDVFEDPFAPPCGALACNDCPHRYMRCSCVPDLSDAGLSMHDF